MEFSHILSSNSQYLNLLLGAFTTLDRRIDSAHIGTQVMWDFRLLLSISNTTLALSLLVATTQLTNWKP